MFGNLDDPKWRLTKKTGSSIVATLLGIWNDILGAQHVATVADVRPAAFAATSIVDELRTEMRANTRSLQATIQSACSAVVTSNAQATTASVCLRPSELWPSAMRSRSMIPSP